MSGAAADPFPPTRSPDGRIVVRYEPQEVRMSLWVMSPTVVRTRDGHEVVTLEFPWSCDEVAFPERDRLLLSLRRYPDGETVVRVVVDVEAETWWPEERPAEQRPVRTLPAALGEDREQRVQSDAARWLRAGMCPDCKAQTLQKRGLAGRLLGDRSVECLVCERRWELPG